ncbi:MAG: trigger factor [Verrucomicrobiales bacterium]|nr:trigger factor [Verrucomicrobiales bacterium]
MNVSVEQLAPCKVLMKIEVDAKRIDEAYELATAEYQKQARLTGFRPGKAPAYLVTRTFSREIEQEVKRRVFSESYRAALEEKKIRVLGQPDVEEVQFARGQGGQFAVTIETEPVFEIPDYKGIPVEVEVRAVTPDDVERGLQAIREQRGEFADVQRPVASGDFVVVNYTGTCEGKPITDHSPTARGLTEQKNFWMKVESKHFIPGFTDQLIGASAGEKRTVTVTFPEDFVVEAVANKAGVYEVEVVQVKERRLPEVDDAFASQFGVPTLEALREGIQRDLDNELKHKRVTTIRNQLVKALLDRVQCELPESVVQNETRNVVRDIVSQNQRRGVTKESIQDHKDEIFAAANTSAKDRVRAALVLNRIAEKENIKVAEQEMLERIAAIAHQRKERPEKVLRELQQNGQINAVAEQILTGKVLDFLQLNALISEVPAKPEPAAS